MTNPASGFDVLLVEDDPCDAVLAKRAFQDCAQSVRIHHVKDGVECLRFLRREGAAYGNAPRPSLMLLDLNMPRMDGREVLAAVKSDAALKEIPVVVLTTSDFEQDVSHSYRLGANSFITKPMDFDHFLSVIQSLEAYWFNVVALPS